MKIIARVFYTVIDDEKEDPYGALDRLGCEDPLDRYGSLIAAVPVNADWSAASINFTVSWNDLGKEIFEDMRVNLLDGSV